MIPLSELEVHEHDILIDGIAEAIDSGKPYDEYEKLSEDEQKAYDDGGLVF